MHEEAGFLSVIRQAPADDTARLVFADWLDEQDAPDCKTKADFIRLELRLMNEPVDDYTSPTVQLQQLAARLAPDWLALLSHPKIEGCRMWLDHECPGTWSRLAPTHEPTARTCAACRKTAYYARTIAEARLHVRCGDCTAVSLAVARQPNDLPTGQLLSGMVYQSLQTLIERPRLYQSRTDRCPDRQERSELENTEPVEDGAPPSPSLPRRQNGRRRNRRIERENWEEME